MKKRFLAGLLSLSLVLLLVPSVALAASVPSLPTVRLEDEGAGETESPSPSPTESADPEVTPSADPTPSASADPTPTVSQAVEETHAIKVGSTDYDDLQTAIDEANGRTIELQEDVVLTAGVTIATGKSVTIDLKGHQIRTGYSNLTTDHEGEENDSSIQTVKYTGGAYAEGTYPALTTEYLIRVDKNATLVVNSTVADGDTGVGRIRSEAMYVYTYTDENSNTEKTTYIGTSAIESEGSVTVNNVQLFGVFAAVNEWDGTFSMNGGLLGGYYTLTAYDNATATIANAEIFSTFIGVEAAGGATVNLTKTVVNATTYGVLIDQGTVNLNNGSIVNANYKKNQEYADGVQIIGSSTDAANYSVLNVDSTSEVNVTASDSNGAFYGIRVPPGTDMNYDHESYGVVVNIAGTVNGSVVVDYGVGSTETSMTNMAKSNNLATINITGTVNGGEEGGVLLKGYATVNVKSGAKISGLPGIIAGRGNLNISGGTISSTVKEVETQTAVVLYPTYNDTGKLNVNITGGTLVGKNHALYVNSTVEATAVEGQEDTYTYSSKLALTVSGGYFNGAIGTQSSVYKYNSESEEYERIVEFVPNAYPTGFVSGGYFTSDPAEFCADGKTGVQNTDSATSKTYLYTVGTKNENAAKVADSSGTPTVSSTINVDNITDETTKDLALAAKTSLESATTAAVSGGGLTAAAVTAANSNSVSKANAAARLTSELGLGNTVKEEDVVFIVQPYMDIELTDVTVTKSGDGDDATVDSMAIKVEITPMVKTVATTNANANSINTTKGEGQNAIDLGDSPLNVTGSVDMSIPLPTTFTSNVKSNTAYVKHVHNGKTYIYDGTIDNNVLTFTNPNGFSEFTIETNDESKAKIGKVGYLTLADAVNDAEDGKTITVNGAENETVTVSKTITLTVESIGTNKLQPGANTELTVSEDGKTYTFTYTQPTYSYYYNYNGGGGTSSGETTKVTNADGSTTTTEKAADGTVTVTTEALNGVKTVTTTTASGDVSAAVTLPAGVDKAVVSIPVADMTSGMVAVNADTGKVVKLSVPTEDGISVAVTESMNLTIVDNSRDFADVDDDYWGADSIAFASAHELFKSTGDDTSFEPELELSRNMMTTILARLDDQDINDTGAEWYVDGMAWAKEKGICDGYNGTRNLTREEMVTMLWRYADEPEAEADGKDISEFADADSVTEYAKDAMAWAVSVGIINGGDNGIDPQGDATRAQVAAVMQRYCTLLTK